MYCNDKTKHIIVRINESTNAKVRYMMNAVDYHHT